MKVKEEQLVFEEGKSATCVKKSMNFKENNTMKLSGEGKKESVGS